jgi:molecular chaperone GrpE (heat shock protein)
MVALHDDSWMELVEGCVEIIDELDRHMNPLDAPRREVDGQVVADVVVIRMEELLQRSGVDVISGEPIFDPRRHQPIEASAKASPGAPISETLSPGFAVGRRVLRRARVRVTE